MFLSSFIAICAWYFAVDLLDRRDRGHDADACTADADFIALDQRGAVGKLGGDVVGRHERQARGGVVAQSNIITSITRIAPAPTSTGLSATPWRRISSRSQADSRARQHRDCERLDALDCVGALARLLRRSARCWSGLRVARRSPPRSRHCFVWRVVEHAERLDDERRTQEVSERVRAVPGASKSNRHRREVRVPVLTRQSSAAPSSGSSPTPRLSTDRAQNLRDRLQRRDLLTEDVGRVAEPLQRRVGRLDELVRSGHERRTDPRTQRAWTQQPARPGSRSSQAPARSARARRGMPGSRASVSASSCCFTLVARAALSAFLNRPMMCLRFSASACSDRSPSSARRTRFLFSLARIFRILLTFLEGRVKAVEDVLQVLAATGQRDAELVDDHAEALALRLAHRVEQLVDVDRRAGLVRAQDPRSSSVGSIGSSGLVGVPGSQSMNFSPISDCRRMRHVASV